MTPVNGYLLFQRFSIGVSSKAGLWELIAPAGNSEECISWMKKFYYNHSVKSFLYF